MPKHGVSTYILLFTVFSSLYYMNNAASTQILRILDANLNRMREALRVMEEFFRFFSRNEKSAKTLKLLRHSLEEIETLLGAKDLVSARDTSTDPFAYKNRPEELTRTNANHILTANFKRAQEAARVIEEYAKVLEKNGSTVSGIAKALRFGLYDLEKETTELQSNE